MPNWTYNLLVVEGEPDRVADFVESVRGVAGDGEPLELDFERRVPTPPEMLVSDGLYAWRRQHRGTKWNASDVVRDGVARGRLHRVPLRDRVAPARLERGDHDPTVDMLRRLAGALDVEFVLDIAPANRDRRLVTKRAHQPRS